jgi:hypothetical protein
MPDWIFKNKPTAYATLAVDSGTSGTTLTLTTGHGTRLPAPGAGQISAVRIENELITYTGNSSDVLTGVTRGAGATNHVAGTEVKNVLVEEWANTVTALSTDTKAALAGTSGTPQAANPYVTDADARNSNARPPTSHGHVESETTGLVADLAARVLSTDSRLSDARTPTTHAISHKATGGDTLASIVGGYAPLDSGLLVPVANLGTGTPTGLKFLRDDRVWAVPAGGGGGFANPMTDGGDLIVGAFIDAYAYLGQDTSGWSQTGSGDGNTYEFAREFSCSQPKLVSGFGWYRQSGDGTPTAFHLFDTTTSTSVLAVTTGIPSTGTGWLWVDCSASGVYLVAGRHYRVSRTRAPSTLWEERTSAPTPDSGITDYGGYLGVGGGVYPTGSDSRWFGVSIRLGSGVTGSSGTPVRKAVGTTGSTLTVDGNLNDGMSWLPSGQVLTDAVTITWDVAASHNAQVTLGGNRTLAAPTNLIAGQVYTLRVVQDGTGSRTLTWNAVFKWPSGTAPTLSTGAGKRDVFVFVTDGTNLYATAQAIDVR